jgi:hypothetical protein
MNEEVLRRLLLADHDRLIQLLVESAQGRLNIRLSYNRTIWPSDQADRILRRMCMAILRYVSCLATMPDDAADLLSQCMSEAEIVFDDSFIARDILFRARINPLLSELGSLTQTRVAPWLKLLCRLVFLGRFGGSHHFEMTQYAWRHCSSRTFSCGSRITADHIGEILHDLTEFPLSPCWLGEDILPCKKCGNTSKPWLGGAVDESAYYYGRDVEGSGHFCGNCNALAVIPTQLGASPWVNDSVKMLLTAAYVNRLGNASLLDNDVLLALSDELEAAGCPTEVTCERCGGNGRIIIDGLTEDCTVCCWPVLEESKRGRVLHPLLRHLRSDRTHYFGCWAIERLRRNY